MCSLLRFHVILLIIRSMEEMDEMKFKDGFEIVHIADEHIAVPVGEKKDSYQGVIVLNEAAAFMLEELGHDTTIDDLIQKLISRYDVGENKAKEDITKMVESLNELGLIE